LLDAFISFSTFHHRHPFTTTSFYAFLSSGFVPIPSIRCLLNPERPNAPSSAEQPPSEVDITVDGSKAGTASPASKKRKSTGVTEIPPVVVKAITAPDQSYTKFGKLPPSTKIAAELNGLINGVPIASLVDPVVAQLFDNVTVYSSFRIII
jgi:hypothetical protein